MVAAVRVPRECLWFDQLGAPVSPRPPLAGDVEADVTIVGAGFTGLWTAYYLQRHRPDLRIVIVERDVVGYGASGRNGGWCVGELAVGAHRVARLAGPEAAQRLEAAISGTVEEVAGVIAHEAIDCGFHHGGQLTLARHPAHEQRLRRLVDDARREGTPPEVLRWMEADEARRHVNATGVRGAAWFAHTAVLQPAELVRALGELVAARGATIAEATPATGVSPGVVETPSGRVRSRWVVVATEAYTGALLGDRRRLIPLESHMIATEPLSARCWDELGLADRPAFADARNRYFYAQRTQDGRLAIGGTAAPYRFGSRVDDGAGTSPVHDRLGRTLVELFPSLTGTRITHRWRGVLAVPRDWHPSVELDRATGIARAGGYVGEGVAAANLAGRTLADLLAGHDSELTDLPWVGHRSRRWEPEPLRWLGTRAGSEVFALADRLEARTGRPSRLADLVWRYLRS
jgi:glycine/D-amino acid oxidase-like deaminating enzyme